MKTLKIILAIIITIVIVVIGFTTEMLTVADSTLLNVNFYSKTLSQSGFYDGIRLLFVNQTKDFVDQQTAIPDEFKQEAYDVIEKAFEKKKFASMMGDFFGGAVSYVLYEKGDAVIPLNTWIGDLKTELKNSQLAEKIVDFEIERGTYTKDEREAYIKNYTSVLKSTYTGYFAQYGAFLSNSDKLSDFIKVMAPTQQIQDRLELQFFYTRYWTNRANQAAYLGLGIIIILIALLFVIWRKSVGTVLKLIGIVLIINAGLFILAGAGMIISLTVTAVLNKLPAIILPYTNILQSFINPIAMIILAFGILSLIIGVVVTVIGGALIRKKNDNSQIEVNNNTTLLQSDEKENKKSVESNDENTVEIDYSKE